jgi:hypothetical protein
MAAVVPPLHPKAPPERDLQVGEAGRALTRSQPPARLREQHVVHHLADDRLPVGLAQARTVEVGAVLAPEERMGSASIVGLASVDSFDTWLRGGHRRVLLRRHRSALEAKGLDPFCCARWACTCPRRRRLRGAVRGRRTRRGCRCRSSPLGIRPS